MNAYQAQRIRFGILAARHTLARETMTPDQVDYLEGCEAVGWRVGNAGTVKAYDREVWGIRRRGILRAIAEPGTIRQDGAVGQLWPHG